MYFSEILRKAANSVRGNKVIAIQINPQTGWETITVNGKLSPSLNNLVDELGIREAWEFLTKEVMVAHDAISDRLIKTGMVA